MDAAPRISPSAPNCGLIFGDRALASCLGTCLSTVRTWRAKGIIPFIKTGHKSIAYELHDVLTALRSLRKKPIAEKGGR
jgi:hypothetical protein